MGRFTEEELQIAKSVDLVDLAAYRNIHLRKKGRYYCVEGMDSLMIFNRSTWYRYSRRVGGSTIDFLMYYENLTFREAVTCLLDFAGYIRTGRDGLNLRNERKEKNGLSGKRLPQSTRKPFILPEKAPDCRKLYAYLTQQRGMSKKVVHYWLEKEMIYESLPYHNIVFLGRDRNGTIRFASQRGTRDIYGKPFKGDVPGNDKRYGVNIINLQSDALHVYEAAIDAMSDMDYRNDYKTSVLALGMVSDGPLKKILEEYPHIRKIHFCLDNDMPGRTAAKDLAEKYEQGGYETEIRFPAYGKDFNEFLQGERKSQESYVQTQVQNARSERMSNLKK